MNDIKNRREYYRSAFIMFLTISFIMLFIFMVRDFLIAILLAGIFCGLLFPVYSRLLRVPVLQKYPGVTSALLLVVVLITIGIPLTGLLSIVTSEAFQISENVTPWVQQNLLPQLDSSVRLPDWLPFADMLDPYKAVILSKLGEVTSATGAFLVRSGSALTQGTASFLLKLFVMIYAMFFFFLRGPEWIHKFAGYLPLSTEEQNQLINRGLSVTSASLKGILGIGLLQGFLVGLAFMIIGLQGAAFWGTITMVLSAVPGIGPPIVWVPAAMYLYLTDQTGWAIGLTIWGILVVGTVDNVLRPLIVGSQAKISDLLILLGILGGIVMFGVIGIIVGPIIIAGLVAILDIYQHAFIRYLPENDNE